MVNKHYVTHLQTVVTQKRCHKTPIDCYLAIVKNNELNFFKLSLNFCMGGIGSGRPLGRACCLTNRPITCALLRQVQRWQFWPSVVPRSKWRHGPPGLHRAALLRQLPAGGMKQRGRSARTVGLESTATGLRVPSTTREL